ncbi:MAG TPA: hypothetical protein VHG91_06490 [Longimicrobium sp.]|nr:hypothetical protein [Longimicrobium sp.]
MALLIGLPLLLGAGQPRLVPVVDARTGYLLGATQGGRWIAAERAAGRIRAGERYRVYAGERMAGASTGTKPKSIEEPCADTYLVDLSPAREGADVAVGGAWNAVPRPVTRLDPAGPVYRAAVRDILQRNGIRNPVVRITRVVRVDLEGDGRDEVIVAASHAADDDDPTSSKAGDYSVLFVRKVVRGQVRTLMLGEQYHPRAATFNAPSTFSLQGVYDLDGDGRLEVLAHSAYYEGASTAVLRVRDDGNDELVSAGCGV